MRHLLTILLIVLAGAAAAVEPDEILDDPVLEARARAISKDVRCVVCQNEPIDSSNAGMARDLRILIRERLVAGDTDEEVKAFLVARYDEYVLFKPPFNSRTYVLWLAPLALLLFGALVTWMTLRSRRAAGAGADLSPEDEARVAELMARYDVEQKKKDS